MLRFSLALLLGGLFLFPVRAQPTPDDSTAVPLELQSITQLRDGIQGKHPATYYLLAQKLFDDGAKDEAVFWFYVGQLRYRFHLTAHPDLEPSGEPALFGALSETVGRPMNEYAFGDLPELVATLDRVLAWDETEANGFTSKAEYADAYEATKAGLLGLRTYVVENEDEIRRQRTENGLENR